MQERAHPLLCPKAGPGLFSFLEIQDVLFLTAETFHLVQQGLVSVGLRLRLERLAHYVNTTSPLGPCYKLNMIAYEAKCPGSWRGWVVVQQGDA